MENKMTNQQDKEKFMPVEEQVWTVGFENGSIKTFSVIVGIKEGIPFFHMIRKDGIVYSINMDKVLWRKIYKNKKKKQK